MIDKSLHPEKFASDLGKLWVSEIEKSEDWESFIDSDGYNIYRTENGEKIFVFKRSTGSIGVMCGGKSITNAFTGCDIAAIDIAFCKTFQECQSRAVEANRQSQKDIAKKAFGSK